MSGRKKGTPLWLDLLVLGVLMWGAWQLVTNPEVHEWVQVHCGWVCR